MENLWRKTLFGVAAVLVGIRIFAQAEIPVKADASAALRQDTLFSGETMKFHNPAFRETGHVKAVVIELTSIAKPKVWEDLEQTLLACEAVEVNLHFSSAQWSAFSIPLDALLVALKPILDKGNWATVTCVTPSENWQGNCVDRWNVLVAQKCFAEGAFDATEARRIFLQETFGPAAPEMREYFRVNERAYLGAAALTGVERPMELDVLKVFQASVLKRLETALRQALEKTISCPEAHAAVEKEWKRFEENYLPLKDGQDAKIRRLKVIGAEWTEAQQFVRLNGDAPTVAASVAISADDEKMSLLFKLEEPRMSSLLANHVGRDVTGIWDDDTVEIFLMPDGNHPEDGYQFIVNAAGAIWDGHRMLTHCDERWDAPHAEAVVQKNADSWQLQVTVPWRDFGLESRPNATWSVNFYRTRFAGGRREAYAWSPVRSDRYYQPEDFGYVSWHGAEKGDDR